MITRNIEYYDVPMVVHFSHSCDSKDTTLEEANIQIDRVTIGDVSVKDMLTIDQVSHLEALAFEKIFEY